MGKSSNSDQICYLSRSIFCIRFLDYLRIALCWYSVYVCVTQEKNCPVPTCGRLRHKKMWLTIEKLGMEASCKYFTTIKQYLRDDHIEYPPLIQMFSACWKFLETYGKQCINFLYWYVWRGLSNVRVKTS